MSEGVSNPQCERRENDVHDSTDTNGARTLSGAADQFVDWITTELESDLRGVFVHSSGDLEVVYAKDGLLAAYSEEELVEIASDRYLENAMGDPFQESLYNLGSLDYVVQGFADAVLVRVPLSETESIVLSLEATNGVDVQQFVRRLPTALIEPSERDEAQPAITETP